MSVINRPAESNLCMKRQAIMYISTDRGLAIFKRIKSQLKSVKVFNQK